ncbi:MAG: DUF2341 domain-containing protein [Desulfobacteraceae bacterium]|nr:DUF2341 domain-containing protein [Desulfobacteraceae bacterium]
MIHKKVRRILLGLLLLVGMSWTVVLPGAQAWWNEDWQYRKKITLDTTPAGADIPENLVQFPVLVRLHSGNFDFTRAGENGEDIRFVSGDDLTLLKYHIEVFDGVDEIALVWVNLPVVKAASNQEGIWLYYGNAKAAAAGDAKTGFDAFDQGVFHFSEIEGLPQDSTAYGAHAAKFSGGLGLAGIMGNGAGFYGAGSILEIPEHPSFNFTSGLTFSAWVKISEPQNNAVLFSRAVDGMGLFITIRGTGVFVSGNDGKQPFESPQGLDLPLEGWHHLAVTMAQVGRVTLYLDGVESKWVDTKFDLSVLKGSLLVGGEADGSRAFTGELDELRIAGTKRSGAWVRANFVSQGPDAGFLAFAPEEINEGGGAAAQALVYLAIIIKNISFDGILIIGVLMVFMGVSWLVMVSKSISLFNTARGNKNFLEQYRRLADPISLDADLGRFKDSGIYRIYEAGRRNLDFLRHDLECGPKAFTAKHLDNLKAVLETGLVEEARRMNAWLMALTLSISGGPFLGLLGTVWGVMNTFAAMAEAGEANIMAIAPGVASALATTVFGLLVAIPALFGYNYLAGKIREVTTDTGLFVDLFALNVDSVYGESS